MTPHDLPEGIADDPAGRNDYLRMRVENGSMLHQRILAREIRDGFSTLLFTPESGHLYDAGVEHYGEFYCSLPDAARYVRDGITLNGAEGRVTVVTRFMNGAQLRFRAAS